MRGLENALLRDLQAWWHDSNGESWSVDESISMTESDDQTAMQRLSERKKEVATGVPGDHPDQQLLLQPTKTQQAVSMFL
jgi:hypothetical protein